MTTLQITWFFLVGVLFTGFAILDGFDLGVGIWHLKARGDRERRTLLNAVGPVWDGNEVWLLTGAGALFAAFPPVYASVFSGFYMAMMLVVFSLIIRAVSMEFRSKEDSKKWRDGWDRAFSVSSMSATLLFGVALGNVMGGVPLDADGNYTGTFFGLLNPYALLIGLTGIAMVALQGANYIALKADGELAVRGRHYGRISAITYAVLFMASAALTTATKPYLVHNFLATPALWAIPFTSLGAILVSLIYNMRKQPGRAFWASSVSVAAMMGLVGAGMFPTFVHVPSAPELSLTLANSSSSELTLRMMLIMAAIGMPVVIGYTVWIYRTFSGKVDPDHPSAHY